MSVEDLEQVRCADPLADMAVLEPTGERDAQRSARSRPPLLVASTARARPPLKGSILGRGGPVIRLGNPIDQQKYIGETILPDGPRSRLAAPRRPRLLAPTAAGYGVDDPLGGYCSVIVLPHTHRHPARIKKQGVSLAIPQHVVTDLRRPIPGIVNLPAALGAWQSRRHSRWASECPCTLPPGPDASPELERTLGHLTFLWVAGWLVRGDALVAVGIRRPEAVVGCRARAGCLGAGLPSQPNR
jgi:hypothetical protein